MLYACFKYSTCDLICNVITCCVLSCDMGKINVCDKIIIENKKRENMEIKEILHKSPSKRSFTNGIHSLLKELIPEEALTSSYLICDAYR